MVVQDVFIQHLSCFLGDYVLNDHGWEPLLVTDLPERGGRLAAWILSMVDDTSLSSGTISDYVWGVRTWHVQMHHDVRHRRFQGKWDHSLFFCVAF